jgi:hypothetical protein
MYCQYPLSSLLLKCSKCFHFHSIFVISFVDLILCQKEHLPAEQTKFALVLWSIEMYTENNLKIIYRFGPNTKIYFLSNRQFICTWLITLWKMCGFITGFPLLSVYVNQRKINSIIDFLACIQRNWAMGGDFIFSPSI